MTHLQPTAAWPDDFCGQVKLFPLPNLVLFPHVVQPLHIFEPRYCELLKDALESDQLIGMGVLEPAWEAQYDHRPSIASTVCVGKIISHTPCDVERYNILLVGLRRARVVRELSSGKPYRMAEVQVMDDIYPPEESGHRTELTQRLHELFQHFVPEGLAAQENFKRLVGKQLPLGILTDTITVALNLPAAIKLQLLAEENVDIRCRILTRCLEQKIKGVGCKDGGAVAMEPLREGFPPRFSEN